MSNSNNNNGYSHPADTHNGNLAVADRRSTETKASTKTTEFFAFVAMVLATALTALVVGDGGEGGDVFNALDAMKLITFLTIGYMVSRGLAKSGSREHYTNS
ncbi:hypothetical protein D6T65_13290 [Arthrobacter frigidicola]|nr:hypothetical protein D6T65_13290 [Arthrobacter frigidicola]